MAIPRYQPISIGSSDAAQFANLGGNQISSGIQGLTDAFNQYQKGTIDATASRTQANTDQAIANIMRAGSADELNKLTALDGALGKDALNTQYQNEYNPLQVAQAIAGRNQQFDASTQQAFDNTLATNKATASNERDIAQEQYNLASLENQQKKTALDYQTKLGKSNVNYGEELNKVINSNDSEADKRSKFEVIAGNAGWNASEYNARLKRVDEDIQYRADAGNNYQTAIDTAAQLDSLIVGTLDENAKAAYGGITGSDTGKFVQSLFNTDGSVKQREYDALLSVLTGPFIDESGMTGVLTDRDLRILRQRAPETNATPAEIRRFLTQRATIIKRGIKKLGSRLNRIGQSPDDYQPLSYSLESNTPNPDNSTTTNTRTPNMLQSPSGVSYSIVGQ